MEVKASGVNLNVFLIERFMSESDLAMHRAHDARMMKTKKEDRSLEAKASYTSHTHTHSHASIETLAFTHSRHRETFIHSEMTHMCE